MNKADVVDDDPRGSVAIDQPAQQVELELYARPPRAARLLVLTGTLAYLVAYLSFGYVFFGMLTSNLQRNTVPEQWAIVPPGRTLLFIFVLFFLGLGLNLAGMYRTHRGRAGRAPGTTFVDLLVVGRLGVGSG